jgi:hypothetical protein
METVMGLTGNWASRSEQKVARCLHLLRNLGWGAKWQLIGVLSSASRLELAL